MVNSRLTGTPPAGLTLWRDCATLPLVAFQHALGEVMRHTIFVAATLAVLLTLAAPARAGMETVRVLVAKQAMNYGATIKPGNLQWVEWPAAAVPPGAFTSVEELLGEKGDQRRIVLRSIEPGELVLEGKITILGDPPRMLMNLRAGMRAVSISIDAAAGFVSMGDRVDVLLTRTQEGQLVSSVILQDITVIGVGQRANSETASPQLGRTVIVEVDTVQAQKLALAQQVGRLSLTLRSIGETNDEVLKPVTADKALKRLMPAAGENGRQRFAKALAVCQAYTSAQRSLTVISENRMHERYLEIFDRRSQIGIEHWAYFPYVPEATAAIKEILATEIKQNWPIRPEAVDFFEQQCHLALYRTKEQILDFIAKSAADVAEMDADQ